MATISPVAHPQVKERARTAPIGIAWRPLTLIVSVVVAYFFSLSDLIGAMQYDTPLAYLGLVPPIAFALGCYRYRRAAATPATIGPLDAAAGGALLVLATLMAAGLPIALDAYAWSKRLDLLAADLRGGPGHPPLRHERARVGVARTRLWFPDLARAL